MLTNIRQKILTGLATSQFFLYGKMHFTKEGYQRHVKKYYDSSSSSSTSSAPAAVVVQSRADICRGVEGADGVDLSGKTIVVTGANNGLGKELATYAAAKGANVYMLCRSKERAEKARDEIIQMTSNSNVKVVLADVGELSQVKSAVEELQAMESQIDCLVCNAGKLLNEKQVTLDGGIESTFASHLLGGSYFLTKLLIPQLQASAKNGHEPRVIYVTSGGMYTSKFPSWDVATNTAQDQRYDGVMAYTYAKRGQVILAEELAKKDKDGILYLTAHPGWTDTQAVDDAFGENKKMFEPLRDVWEGAEGMAWLMGASSGALENGAFYLDRKVQPKHLAGAFMTEGSFTKNTSSEIEDMMTRLKQACGV